MYNLETSPMLEQQENAIREMEWLNKKIKKDSSELDNLLSKIELLAIENSYLKEIQKKDAEIIQILESTIKLYENGGKR